MCVYKICEIQQVEHKEDHVNECEGRCKCQGKWRSWCHFHEAKQQLIIDFKLFKNCNIQGKCPQIKHKIANPPPNMKIPNKPIIQRPQLPLIKDQNRHKHQRNRYPIAQAKQIMRQRLIFTFGLHLLIKLSCCPFRIFLFRCKIKILQPNELGL